MDIGTRNIILIGPMGSGKSSVGRKLATTLGREFFDSDEEIEARTGVDIPFIFDKEGESGFRRRERELIKELTEKNSIVLATGGGAAQDDSNRALMRTHGIVVYLFTSVAQQLERTNKSRQRPLLKNEDPEQTLRELMSARDPQYRDIADLVVDTDGRQVATVVKDIVVKLDELKDA
ncbi:MAG: shikimate kinase AroK [Gammaproteobacteria bacterium]